MATDHKGKQSGFTGRGKPFQGRTGTFGKPAGQGYGSRGAGQGGGDKSESRGFSGKPASQGYGKKTTSQGYGSKPAGQSFSGKKSFGQAGKQFDGKPEAPQRSGYNPNARDFRQHGTSSAPGSRQGRPAGFGDRSARPFGRGGNQGQSSGYDNRSGNQRFGDRYQRDNRPPQTEAQWRESPAAKRFGPTSQPGRPFGQPATSGRQARPQRQPQTPEHQKLQVLVQPEIDSSIYAEESIGQVNLLTGRNPIREAIKTGRDLEKLMIAKGELTGSAKEIVSLAKKAGIMIQSVERSRLDQLAKNHQGMIAYASAYQYASVEDILAAAKEKGEDPFIIVLDQITDPHNLGAVIRTLVCAGAHGVIVPQHRAVGLTPAAVKASSGAVEHTKVARVTNLNQTIKSLQKQGIWFYCATTDGEDYRKQNMTGPCALVIGSEGEGVSQLTASLCDKAISIPMAGEIGSLNASVAAAILMYSVFNARNPA